MVKNSKQLLLQIMYNLGLLRFVVTCQRNKVTILMLHGVTNPATPAAWVPLRPQLTPVRLSKALAVLARYYRFVSLPDAVEMLAGSRPVLANALALTFDDGYRNNLQFALPILRRYHAPATIYLSTGNVTEQKPFWFDRLDYAVQAIRDKGGARHGIPELVHFDFSNRESLTRSFLAFIRSERERYPTDTAMRSAMANLSERLEQCSGHGLGEILRNDPWAGVLTWEEIRQASHEVHFGSHGVDHPLLALMPSSEARKELIASREAIEAHTGQPCRHLAYPNGSFNAEVIHLSRTCGYCSAVTIIQGLNHPGDEMLTLRRLAFPHGHEPAGILAAVSSLSS